MTVLAKPVLAKSGKPQVAPALFRLLSDSSLSRAALGACGVPVALLDANAKTRALTYVNAAPFQPAIAVGLRLPDAYFRHAAGTLQGKRDLLGAGLSRAGFTVTHPQGGYFIIADAAPLGFTDGGQFCRELPTLAGVVAVPVSAFVREDHADAYRSLVRFAYCKKMASLEAASAQLMGLGSRG